jgi:tetratricopeptide (TPR) repeat protein
VDGNRPAPHRFAARIYEDIGAVDLAEEAAERATARAPADAGAWERLGRLRLGLLDREGACTALRRALELGADGDARELLTQALALEPSVAQAS